MANKTENAFQKHLRECRIIARFNGIVTRIDEQVLHAQYFTKPLKEFREYAIDYFKSKREEN